MKSRRAGHGCSGALGCRLTMPDTGELPADPRIPAAAPRTTLGDDPRIAAALRYAGEDVRAYEQTEAAWRAVWGVSDP